MPRALQVASRTVVMAFLLVMAAGWDGPWSQSMASDAQDAAVQKSTQPATLKPAAASSPDVPFTEFDSEAEHVLLNLANQDRKRAGAASLKLDAGLSQAARIHAEAMFAARQLSHQLTGELALPQRLASATQIQLDREGENIALDFDAADGHRHLMLSPPHRANLMNPAYNVIGLGVVRSGDRLYIVQDFGHALPNYSAAEVKERIAATVALVRRQAKQPALARRDITDTDAAACSMAQADKLGTSPIHELAQRYTVLTYTSLQPEILPAGAERALCNHNLRSVSVGSCYARTETYPTGAYWVVLALE